MKILTWADDTSKIYLEGIEDKELYKALLDETTKTYKMWLNFGRWEK